ncbi:hypothetical protein IFM89_009928 [Coptis chinensis]|uniref:Neprosin PEP catalytic domain-containing protein n=1 Tax=Coptis chinensis TaxID=261450 RepID=A0A835I2N0_9MAGN|nr:hypothetical protein IFM89_009928 [Coptis chinensis]
MHQNHKKLTRHKNSSSMASTYCKILPIIPIYFVCFLLFISSAISPVFARSITSETKANNQTFQPRDELLKRVRAHLRKINKPPVKTIQSPDGDIIDCVLSHQQLAFDHPQLQGQKPLDPPERPNGHNATNVKAESLQLWSLSACSWVCIGTTVLRSKSKLKRVDTTRGKYVSPELYGDSHPRFFTYWTTDAYQATGCYNLLCSGFIQTNNKIAIGAAISPTSSYNGRQFDISILVWKDPKRGHWWLEFGHGLLVGYWPSFIFSHLRNHANMIQFGGEVVNTRPSGFHTYTQMGSGQFAGQGFGKASYFRNMQVVDWDNNLLPTSNIRLLADHSSCYDIRGGKNNAWGNYFYYGGPGRNVRCP